METKILLKSIDDFFIKRNALGPKFSVNKAKMKSNEYGGECVCCVAADTTTLSRWKNNDSDKTSLAGSK